MWVFEDSSGNHFTVVESLGSKAHLSQPTGIDELENLGRQAGQIKQVITTLWGATNKRQSDISAESSDISLSHLKLKEKAFNSLLPPSGSCLFIYS